MTITQGVKLKYALPLILLLILSSSLHAQPPQLEYDIPIEEWPETVSIRMACLAPDGILVAGRNILDDNPAPLFLMKLNFHGELQWTRESEQGELRPAANVYDMKPTPNAGCVLVGRLQSDDENRLLFFDAFGDYHDDLEIEFNPWYVEVLSDGYAVGGIHEEYWGDELGWKNYSDFKRISNHGWPNWHLSRGPSWYGSIGPDDIIQTRSRGFCLVESGMHGNMPIDLLPFVDINHVDHSGDFTATFDLGDLLPGNGWTGTAWYVDGIQLLDSTQVSLFVREDYSYEDGIPRTRVTHNNLQGDLLTHFDLLDNHPVAFLGSQAGGYSILSDRIHGYSVSDTLELLAVDSSGEILGATILDRTAGEGSGPWRAWQLPLPNSGQVILYQNVLEDSVETRFSRFLPPETPYVIEILSPVHNVELPSSGGLVELELRAIHSLPQRDSVLVEIEIGSWGTLGGSIASWTDYLEPGQMFQPPPVMLELFHYDDDGMYLVTVRASNTDRTIYNEDRLFLLKGPITSVHDPAQDHTLSPAQFSIVPHPNPFNGILRININLPSAGRVRADVFNILGQKVELLHDGPLKVGKNIAVWNAESATSGVYFIRAISESGDVAVDKVLLLK
jgi:Secretion system C-terminal sorting domain